MARSVPMQTFAFRLAPLTALRDLVRRLPLLAAMLLVTACAPLTQGAIQKATTLETPILGDDWVRSFDGSRLGLSHWAAATDADARERIAEGLVIVAVHGMNDYAGAFRAAAQFWSHEGAEVYAYDQRGFGRSPNSGIWADPEVLREDLRTVTRLARAAHPGSRVLVVGESMGAAVAITAFASADPPDADALVLSAPGLRGWGALPFAYKVSLWMSAHVRPGWVVVPPKGVRITPTDNREKLVEMWNDPHVLKTTRIDAVYGVVDLMEEANDALPRLDPETPTLLLYGGRDEVIPRNGVERGTRALPANVRTAFYEEGYHLLLNDLSAERVWRDIAGFGQSPVGSLPSAPPELPWLGERRSDAD
ncbi:alpha/beta fold hydrolase [bacterium]|nr:alpha/beta fold hydrolase [bacterium]